VQSPAPDVKTQPLQSRDPYPGAAIIKVSIVGIGKVGSALALTLIARGIVDDLVLIGRKPENPDAPHFPTGEAMDLLHASALTRPARVRAGDIADAAGSAVIAICIAGRGDVLPREANFFRNADIFRELIPALAAVSPEAILLITTNPLDAMTTLALQLSKYPPSRVLGTGTLLDTMRLRVLLSEKHNIHPRDIRAYVLGEHGDTQFVAGSSASAGGARIGLDTPGLQELEAQTRAAGYAIMHHKGFTNVAVAMSAASIIEAIANDSKEVLPVSTLVTGFAGVSDICLSLPTVLGRQGVLQTLQVELTAAEQQAFQKSADYVRKTLAQLPTLQV
jgi:L-lactate dehydrogenase